MRTRGDNLTVSGTTDSGSLSATPPVEGTAAGSWWRAYDDVVGMNARNAHIAHANSPDAVRLVTDKWATKEALAVHDVPVAPTLQLVRDGRAARRLTAQDLPDEWVIKPNQGLGGTGIMIAAARSDTGWQSPSQRPISALDVKDHLRFILDGEFSGRARDTALVEPLLVTDPGFARLAHRGLPDIRVICSGDTPRLAMARLPTASSGGRANLHQGAIGAAVDLETGQVVAARIAGRAVERHPDTEERILEARVPYWNDVLRAASRCSAATGLGYVGADIVIDRELGPLVLEVNARPGLQIQNVSSRGIRSLLTRSEVDAR